MKTFSEYEASIVDLVNTTVPADDLVDFDAKDLDRIKGDILTHLMQNSGSISDSDVLGIVHMIQVERQK